MNTQEKLTAEEFVRQKLKARLGVEKMPKALNQYAINCEDALRMCHEFANIKTQELQKEIERLKGIE